MKVIAEFVDRRNGKRYFSGDGNKINPPLEDDQIERLKKAGCLADGTDPKAEKSPVATGLSAMTKDDLIALAELHKITLPDGARKQEIVDLLEASNVQAA